MFVLQSFDDFMLEFALNQKSRGGLRKCDWVCSRRSHVLNWVCLTLGCKAVIVPGVVESATSFTASSGVFEDT